MKIKFRKTFFKQYHKLSRLDKKRVDNALEIFRNDPRDPRLSNHELGYRLKDKRSISAGYDLRIVFRVEGDYVMVIVLDVGSHSRVY